MKKMNLNVPENSELRLRLRDHQVFSTEQADGMVLECLRGGVWATFDGDRADHFLQPGERFVVTGRGQAVIQALEDSEIALFPVRQDVAAPRTVPVQRGTQPRVSAVVGCNRPQSVDVATGCWRNRIFGASSARLGLERTF